ncbi:hypothetical protein K4K53_002464 [Colletotrichum sp. SAR 10_77]|nr:hypothetical protein K4K53_002464 [Colletotrichum sp. SAR 10_77]
MDGKLQSPSTWQRYKLGQARVTDWLKQTASKFTPSPTPPDASEGNGSSAGTRKPKLDAASDKVHWSELEHMAETIANNSKPEEIPWDPILVLRDVVALRKKSARFYSKTADQDKTGKLKLSNQQHEHIIKVLEKVLGVLESAVSGVRPKQKEEPRRASDRLDMKLLDNMFNLLQFQKPGKPAKTPKPKGSEAEEVDPDQSESEPESEEEEEEAPKAKAPGRKPAKKAQKKGKGGKGKKGKKASKPKGGAKKSGRGGDSDWVDRFSVGRDPDDVDDEDLDYYMLIYCFFEDFNTIRNHIAERWADYFYDKSVSLNTLAVITNAAAELFRSMERELLVILRENGLSKLGTYDAMMEMLFFEYGMEHVDYDDKPATKEEQDEKIWREESDWLAWSAYNGIRDIFDHMPPGKVPTIPPSARRRPQYGPITLADFMKFNSACMFDLFPEIATVKALKKTQEQPPVIPGQPEMELDFEKVLELRMYPSHFIFSLQLYLDIRNIIDSQVEVAFEQLQETGKVVAECLRKSIETCDAVFTSEWKNEAKRDLHIMDCYIFEDFTLEDKERRADMMGIPFDEGIPEYELFRCEPVWPALLDFRTKLQSTIMSIRLLTRTPEPLWSGVLYTIAKRDYPGMPSWPEFDKFLAFHGTDLLGFNAPATSELKASDVLVKYTTMSNGKRYHVWGDLLKKVDRVAKFHERYAEIKIWERGNMDYIAHIARHHLGLPVDSNVSPFGIPQKFAKSRQATSEERTKDMLQRIQRVGNMRHIEVLQILDQVVESIVQGEFAINYYKLNWEIQNFVAFLQEILSENGMLGKPDGNVDTYLASDDNDVFLGEAIKWAIGRSAEQPCIPRVSDRVRDKVDKNDYDYQYKKFVKAQDRMSRIRNDDYGGDEDWTDDDDDGGMDSYDRFERIMEGGMQGDYELSYDDLDRYYGGY